MPTSSGALSFLGLAKETTFGTGVAPAVWMPFLSESFRDGPEAIQEAQNMGYLDQSPMYKGMQVVSGQLSGVVYPDTIGHILRAALGPDTVSGPGPFIHTFTPLQTPAGANNALPSYSFQLQRQGATRRRYVGMVCTSLSFSFSQGGLLKFDSSWIGHSMSNNPTAGVPALSSVAPFQLTAAITKGGSAYADIQEYSAAVETPVEPVRTINNSDLIQRISLNGHRTFGLSGTADYIDEALYDDFKAWNSPAWAITHTQGTNILALNIPAGLVNDFSTSAGGPGRLTADFNVSAMYDSATSRAFNVVLTNSVSGVY